jgi:4-diphosphocytidyl-2-C-methyl-D-erythritol kinase
MENITIKTPAKINFGLNVIAKRADGFHNIETIYYPVDIWDTITFSESDKFIFETDNETLNSENDNIILKAVSVLEDHSKKKLNAKIHLSKKIPIGAGLGGGSSDAAAVLKTLNSLFRLNIDSLKLNEMAANIGSDVPFFLNPYPSFASSRGEVLEQINFKIDYAIFLINPGIFVSTKWAYEKVKPRKSGLSLIELYRIGKLKPENFKEYITNDFEKPVMEEFQAIRKLKEELYEMGADFALMSGSGSSLFAIFRNPVLAVEAKEYYENQYFTYLQFSD